MAFSGFLLYFAAGNVTGRTNRRDTERGLEIFPEDTLEEAPYDGRNGNNEEEYIEDDHLDLNNGPRHHRFASFNSFSRSLLSMDAPTWFHRAKSFVFPPKEDVESFIPNYRFFPIISGLLIPFSILLEVRPQLSIFLCYFQTPDSYFRYQASIKFSTLFLGY